MRDTGGASSRCIRATSGWRFTAAVDVADLAALGVPVVVDIGSGLLAPDPLLPDEPDADTALRAGATLVTASGDKLLGGPQADWSWAVARGPCRCRHPLARALRVHAQAGGPEATLRGPVTPTWRALHADPDEMRRGVRNGSRPPTRVGSKPRSCRRTVWWVAAERRVWC